MSSFKVVSQNKLLNRINFEGLPDPESTALHNTQRQPGSIRSLIKLSTISKGACLVKFSCLVGLKGSCD